ncbi:MAG: tetratricopeptide repeat protein [Rhodospirillaceae bacterium]|nr:tetratricopeptide repeat protein [Rhodospirillaceae bacterium]
MNADPRLEMAQKYYNAQLDDQAWAIVAEIVAEADPPAAALQFAASLRYEARDLPATLGFCDRLLAADPHHPHALLLKGRALFDLGRAAEADAVLAAAMAADPNGAAAAFNRGLVLEALTRLDEAEVCYRRAVALQSPYPVAWNNLGNVLDRLGRPDDAVTAFRTALDQFPGYSAAHNNLGATLAGQGRFAAAAQAYGLALDADPDNLGARLNLGVAEVERGRVAVGRDLFAQVLRADPTNTAAADNHAFAAHYDCDDPAAVLATHRRFAAPAPARPGPVVPDPDRRLRVGYVSGDFRRHSVAFFSEPLIAAHDREAVEVVCYATNTDADDVTARLKSLAGAWRNLAGLGTADAVRLVRDDRIDVLVDLSGHSLHHRLDVFAARPAPVQVTAIGYPGTTGMTVFDARLCDAITDPPGAEAYASEPLVRLPMGLHCYRPPSDAPAVAARPAATAGRVTFASFNKLAKISDRTVDLWSAVLAAVPGARLMIKTKPLVEPASQDELRARFARHGVAPQRLLLSGWLADDRDHLAAYHHADIALDTFPYAGTTTTCEALWMGVPVLTRAGRGHAARVGASLLTTVGLADWIASDDDAFVRTAAAMARDPERLADLRSSLRARVAASPLCDAGAYARGVEAVYRALWRAVLTGS